MRASTTLRVSVLMVLLVSSALAQTKVGEVLDSGAVRMSGEEFRQQIVGHYLVGTLRSGSMEVVYLQGGLLRGSGSAVLTGGAQGGGQTFSIEGTWRIDEHDRICESTRLGSVVLAPRCQFWFRQSEKYFLADSDWDRSALVTLRTIKKM